MEQDDPMVLYPMFEKAMAYMTGRFVHFCDFDERLPQYFKAIMREIKLAEDYYAKVDAKKVEYHLKRAMGYYKKGLMLIKEGKA
jgi:hypothetical protein